MRDIQSVASVAPRPSVAPEGQRWRAHQAGFEGPRRTLAITMLCALVCGCAASSPTRLHVVVTAGPTVRERMSSVRLRVTGGRAPDSTETAETRSSDAIEWPAEAWIVPRDGDASRPVRVEVEALGPSGQTIARVGASTSFVLGETRTLRMHLDDGCLGAPTCEVAPPCCVDAGAERIDGGGGPDPRTTADAGRCASRESCEGTIDDDCDARVDEGCECVDGAARPCEDGTEVGACTRGTQACAAGRWRACEDRVSPRAEDCNGVDDDCDGDVDEDLTRPCGRRDRCTQRCRAGAWSPCDRDCDDDDDDDDD